MAILSPKESTLRFILTILPPLLVQAPLFLVWFLGIILSLIWRQRHPQVSLLVIISSVILVIETFVGTLVTVWLPAYAMQNNWTSSQIGGLFSVIGLIRTLFSAVAWGLILMAVFRWRKG